MFFIDYWYIVLVVPAILLGLLAQSMVSAAFNKYSKIRTSYGYTAEQVARQILDQNGLYNVQIQRIQGNLTDNYNPQTNIVSLSDSVYGNNSIAAIGVAAHEVGHAIQHAKGYFPIKVDFC